MPNDSFLISRSNSTWLHQTWRRGGSEAGVALVVVVGALVLVLALAGALILTSTVETRIAATFRDDGLVLSAADAGVQRAVVDLRNADWNSVLAGAISTFSDGPPGGVRTLPDKTTVNLDEETSDLRCGKSAGCSEADVASTNPERPWGPQNPRWRLFAYGPLADLLGGDSYPPPVYVAVWVADDPTDADGDFLTDEAVESNPGRGILELVARAYGPGGIRRTVQVTVQQVGADVRILAWRERHL